MKIKKIYGILFIVMILVGFSPLVWAGTNDTVIITFDPIGDIDIDISYASYDFGSITGNSNISTSGNYFTLYNNGTVAMDTEIKTNATTDESNMNLDTDGNPGLDYFSIYINDLDTPGYLTTSYVEFDQSLSPGSKTFDITLYIGYLSTNHGQQTTTIYFQGSQS